MTRVLLAFLVVLVGGALLGGVDAVEWPRVLLLLAMSPFILAGTLLVAPVVLRPKRRPRP